ncbi:hypothetical protein QBC32DRAFT_138965 [Pseudoneurospora amorphoporcata]|uniref:Uncharacterized protein n=1 Tax=Pseudoneurospora amorphoporcata TaxID=241081 RepID=A0AAN6SGC5_9PEZI|nr:hypothetical protein QBC32DRAFT_138965 [Pseudoneurospora amorphoporcata]
MDETTTPERPSGRAGITRPSSAEEANITPLSPTGFRFNPPKPKDVEAYEKKPLPALPPIPPKRRPAAATSSQKDLDSAKGVHLLPNITGAGPPEKIKNRQNSGGIDWEKVEAEINSIIAKQLTPRGGTPISASASSPAPRTPKPLQMPPAYSERTLGSSSSQQIISPQPRSPVSNILQLDSFGPSPPLSPTRQSQKTKLRQLSGPDPVAEQRDRFSNSENNATEKHTTGYISPVSSRSSFYSQYRDSTVSEAGSGSLAWSNAPRRYDSPVSTEYSPKAKPNPNIGKRLVAREAPSPIPRPLQPRKVSDTPRGGGNGTARNMSPAPSANSDHSGISITDARELYHETTAQIARNTGGSWAYPNALSQPPYPHPGSSVGIPSPRSAGGPGHARFLSEDSTSWTTGDSKRERRESQQPLLSPLRFVPVPQQPPPVRPPREDELPLSLPSLDSAADTLVPADPVHEDGSQPRSRPRSNSQSSRGSRLSRAASPSLTPSTANSQNAALKTHPRNRAQTISVSTFGHHNELRRQWDSGSPQLEVGGPLPLALEDNLALITEFAKHGSHHTRNHSDGDYGDGETRTSLFRRSLVSKVFRRVSGSTPGGGASPATSTPTSTPTTISTPTAIERGHPTQNQTAAQRYHDQSSKTAAAAVGATPLVHRPRTADSGGGAGQSSSFSFSTTSSSTSSASGIFPLPQTLKVSGLAAKTNELLVGGRLARKTKSEKKRENLKNSIRVLADGGRVKAPVEFITGKELLSPPERPARSEEQGWL